MSNANKPPEPKRQAEIDRYRRLEAENLTLRAQLEKRDRELAERDRKLAERDRKLAEKDREIDGLKSELAHARSTSATSSKPPSSDIVKPRRAAAAGKRKIGGQAGHPMHVREPFKPGEINANVVNYTLDCCPDCKGALVCHAGIQNIVQQVEIRKYPVDISEHRGHFYWCAKCEKQHDAPVPPEIEKAGLCGPRLTTLIAYLKGACHASFSTIRKFLRDVAGIRVSRGMLAKVIGKVSWALAEPYAELRGLLPGLGRVNVDETGHKENRAKMWTWCFRAELFVLFKIDSSRGSRVLVETLGAEFNGVLGCDYFSAYRKYMKDCDVSVQFCLAHLIRDVKFLVTLPDAATRAYGERLLTGLRGLFGAIHKGGTSMPAELAPARARILLAAKTNIPATREAQNMAKRFELHGDAYFQFITTPGIEPTNNLAEQAIRFVVIDRLVTQGTRSEKGRRWCERIWTAVATCSLQAASVFDFIESAVRASFNGLKSPSLLPATS